MVSLARWASVLVLALAPLVARAFPLASFPSPRVEYGAESTPLPLLRIPGDERRMYVAVEDPVQGAILFFLDTGYHSSTCDDDFVERLGLRSRSTLAWTWGELGKVPLRKAVLPDLLLGGHRVRSLVCAVRDLGTTSSIPDHPAAPVAGVLGANVLNRFVVEIDPVAGELRLLNPREARVGREPGTTRLGREFLGLGRRPMVRVEVGTGHARCLLDTGASGTYLDAQKLDLPLLREVQAISMGSGRVNQALRDIEIFDAQSVSVADCAVGPLEIIQRSRSMWSRNLLGQDVLGRLDLRLDARHHRLALRLVEPVPLPMWPDWNLERLAALGDVTARARQLLALDRVYEALALVTESGGGPLLPGAPLDLRLARVEVLEAQERYADATSELRALVQDYPEDSGIWHRLGLRLLATDPAAAMDYLEGPDRIAALLQAGALPDPADLRIACGADDPLLCAVARQRAGLDPDWRAVARLGVREAVLAWDMGADPAILIRVVEDPVLLGLLREASGEFGAAMTGCASLRRGVGTDGARLAIRCGQPQQATLWLRTRRFMLVERDALADWYDAMAELSHAMKDVASEADYRRRAREAWPLGWW